MYRGERFNTITHLIGVVLAVIGLWALLRSTQDRPDIWKTLSFAVYGVLLVLLYSSSTLYHSARGPWKRVFQKVDHLAIYLLIAGSYTPFALVTLKTNGGWTLFAIIWFLALVGISQELWIGHKTRLFSMLLYLSMGWLVIVVSHKLFRMLQSPGFALLLAGGLFYTFGIIFYANDHRWKHAHGIWHLFVMAGSISHYFTILLFVA